MREKFKTRIYPLNNFTTAGLILSTIGNLPLDRNLEVVIREQVKQRGLDQNGLYWSRVGEIAEQAWLRGRQYSKETWHEYLARNEMPEEIVTKDGEVRSKWEESPDGSMTVISTSRLSKGSFAEYTERVEAFGAGLGVRFSAGRMSEW